MKIVLATGGFDPCHSGHIAYLKAAKNLGDMLIVGVNSDDWLKRKKGRVFMDHNDRMLIVSELACVDAAYRFHDDDDSARRFIQYIREHYPDAHLIFANGGDRTLDNIPEMDVEDPNLEFAFGIGGTNKLNSSSDILKRWASVEVFPRPRRVRPSRPDCGNAAWRRAGRSGRAFPADQHVAAIASPPRGPDSRRCGGPCRMG